MYLLDILFIMILIYFPIYTINGYHNELNGFFSLKLPNIGNKIFSKTFGRRSTNPLANIKIGK